MDKEHTASSALTLGDLKACIMKRVSEDDDSYLVPYSLSTSMLPGQRVLWLSEPGSHEDAFTNTPTLATKLRGSTPQPQRTDNENPSS